MHGTAPASHQVRFRATLSFAVLDDMIAAFTFFSRLNSAIHSSRVNPFTVAACTVRSIQSVASPPKK
jgi:hypothetical protein